MRRAGLYFLAKSKMMNADTCLQVLQRHMLSFFHIHECEVFMQDSAPCNEARKVKKFLGSIKLI